MNLDVEGAVAVVGAEVEARPNQHSSSLMHQSYYRGMMETLCSMLAPILQVAFTEWVYIVAIMMMKTSAS